MFENEGQSYQVRNISKVTDLVQKNRTFGGVAVNGLGFLASIVGLGVEFVGCKVVAVIAILVCGFNLYNMFIDPKTDIVKVSFVSGEEIKVQFDEEEQAIEFRRALDEAMARY